MGLLSYLRGDDLLKSGAKTESRSLRPAENHRPELEAGRLRFRYTPRAGSMTLGSASGLVSGCRLTGSA